MPLFSYRISDIDLSVPADTSPASSMAEEIRKVRAYLRGLLSSAFTDDMKLKPAAMQTNTVPDNSIQANQIADNAILSRHLATESVDGPKIVDEAINTPKIAPRAVTTEKLADSAVTDVKLANNAVGTAHIKNGSITADKLADGAVAGNTITSLDGSKLTANSTPVDKLKKPDSGVTVPVLTPSEAVLATIGGDVTATLEAGVLKLNVGVASKETVAVIHQTSSGDLPSGKVWARRMNLSLESGSKLVSIVSDKQFKFLAAGTYLVLMSAQGYSCGKFKVVISRDVTADSGTGHGDAATGTELIIGNDAYAAPGTQATSWGAGIIDVDEGDLSKTYSLVHHYDLPMNNGQGLPTDFGLAGRYATILIIGVG
jgi:hypothetical protein